MSDMVGQIIRDYEILEPVGQGGMGMVYRARHLKSGKDVALKTVFPEHLENPKLVQRIRREITVTQSLSHPHIVKMYQAWQEGDRLWMVMEWVTGGSLRDTCGQWHLADAAVMLEQVCDALHAAHTAQVVHRDIKPDNILIDEDGIAHVTDFGAAKPLDQAGITGAGTLVGSPAYLSPEQILSGKISPQTDSFQLGITLFEVLTGKHPFAGIKSPTMLMLSLAQEALPPIHEADESIPPSVNDVIQTATATSPDDRYTDIRDFALAFQAAIS